MARSGSLCSGEIIYHSLELSLSFFEGYLKMSMLLMVKAMQIKVGNPLRKLVLIKLADNASDSGECWPSYQHIADQCEIDRSTVRKHIKALADAGFLKLENREGPKGNSSNLYTLTLDKKPENTDLPVGPESTPVGPESTPPVGPESTRTSHSSEPVKESLKDTSVSAKQDLIVQEIFDHWKLTMNSPRSKLDNKRIGLIVKALKNYSSADLKLAITGNASSDFNMGKNDRGTKYNGLDLILRDADHIDKYIAMAENPVSSSVTDWHKDLGL